MTCPLIVSFFVQSVPDVPMDDLVESMMGFCKFGGISPSEYWKMTYEERNTASKKLNEILKEESKIKAKRDENFLKALGKMLQGMFSKR